MVDQILSTFEGTETKVVGYADDIMILVPGTDPDTMVQIMNKNIRKIESWGSENGLMFNPDKTVAVHFTFARKLRWQEVKVGGKLIEYSTDMKYLGVTLQQKLSWGKHVTDKVKKATKVMCLANAVTGQRWGLNPERILWVYTAMVRPVATYGSVVWAHDIPTSIIQKLNGLQRRALLCMGNPMRSTPTAGMEAALGLIPLDIYAKGLARKTRLRTRKGKEQWVSRLKKKGHRQNLDRDLEEIGALEGPLDSEPGVRSFITNEKVENPQVLIYTDGSCTEGVTGCGFVSTDGENVLAEEATYLGTSSSAFQAEVTAIERALIWATQELGEGSKVTIRTDCSAAISSLLSTKSTSVTVNSCKRYLRKAKENLLIALEWVKAHSGDTLNEHADSLAKSAARTKAAGPEPFLPRPAENIKKLVTRLSLREWQERWTATADCRQSRELCPRVSTEKLHSLVTLGKHQINLLFQGVTGHALLANHLSKWHNMEDLCGLCLEHEESMAHILNECPALQGLRDELDQEESQGEERILRILNHETVVELMAERGHSIAEPA